MRFNKLHWAIQALTYTLLIFGAVYFLLLFQRNIL